MYCILVTGIPASGKTTVSEYLSEELMCPVISKDKVKEELFDTVGFKSREEKNRLGVAAMQIMYYFAEQLMKHKQLFILENNFEYSSKGGLLNILNKYGYTAITVTLTGDYSVIYDRFVIRDQSPSRHRGHVVNDCYPETIQGIKHETMSYKEFEGKIISRGMDDFCADGPTIRIDTTDFSKVNMKNIVEQINGIIEMTNK